MCQNKKVIAKAGGIEVTSDEFRLRYEFTPHPQKLDFNEIEKKKEFLYTLIAEKLLAEEAIRNGLNNEKEYLELLNYLREIYLRDALYLVEVKNKVVISDSLMNDGLKKIGKEYYIKFIFSTRSSEIDSIFTLLKNGADFDSLLINRPEAIEQPQIKKITFGEMHPSLENEIYYLLPGMITKPVRLSEGWYICKIYDLKKREILNHEDKSKVKRIISNREEEKLYMEFYRNFFKGVQVNADKEIFDHLVNALFSYINKNEAYFSKNSRFRFQLGEAEIKEIKSTLSTDLSKVFIKFDTDPITLDKFIINLMYGGINFNSSEFTHIKNVLNSKVRDYIQNQLLVREAIRREYFNLPEMKRDLQIWSDYYLSHILMKRIYLKSEVTDNEALEFYNKENQIVQLPDSVKIAQLLTKELDVIETILKKLSAGEKFTDICREYNYLNILGADNYISEYFPVSETDEIGKIASRLNVNEIYGPIKFNNGYLMVQLLDKKPGKKEKVGLFEEAREDIKSILRSKKMVDSLDTITSSLALKNGLVINEDEMKKLNLSDVNMIVLRRFGFGGQLLAVPYLKPHSSWYNLYLDRLKKDLP
jgi:peptidyl-prolyl cis-trans isomerase C